MGTTNFKKPILLLFVLLILVPITLVHGQGVGVVLTTTTPTAAAAAQPAAPALDLNINLGKIKNRIETTFNVVNHGAKADGKTECGMKIQGAWIEACKSKGPARVVIPSGTYLANQILFAGPCASTSPIVVQIDGVLKGGLDISEFYSDDWLLFENVNGVVITGKGTLDGQGSSAWKYNNCPDDDESCGISPANIKFNRVKNALVDGINSINSKGPHIFITYSSDIRVRKLRISAPKTSPHTDGVRVINSNNVKVSRVSISTGHDCISIGQGSASVAIDRITCGPGYGISVGSPGVYPEEGDVRGVTVKNCTLTNTNNGVRIRSWSESPPSAASAMVFQDINMNNVQNPIVIDQESSCSSDTKVCNKPASEVRINDVHFINIKGSSASPVGVEVKCSKKFPCQNIELSDINLKYSGPPNASFPFTSVCTNANVVHRGLQFPPPCK